MFIHSVVVGLFHEWAGCCSILSCTLLNPALPWLTFQCVSVGALLLWRNKFTFLAFVNKLYGQRSRVHDVTKDDGISKIIQLIINIYTANRLPRV